MSDERRLEVLRAIVQDYVATSEPVGSKALLERHQLGVSAATIRNDMAALEDAGLISAPHTSAGRVPTDVGYRIFVDRLSQVRPLSATQRRAIETFLRQSVDLDDIVERTARLLATLTNQAAVMQYPSLRRSRVRHIELVPAAEGRLSLVVILDSGRIEQRLVSVASADDERLVQTLRARVNKVSGARLLTEAAAAMTELGAEFEPGQRADVDTIVATIAAVFAEDREERVVLAGTANLARAGLRDDAGLSVSRVLEALEEHVGDPGVHAELGDRLIWFAIPLLVLSAALVWLDRRRTADGTTSSRRATSPGLLRTVAALALVAGLAATVQVYRVGDSGARAAWGDQVSSSSSSSD